MVDIFPIVGRKRGYSTFWVKVRPNASETKVISILDDETIKIAIAAPPDKGKANRELIQFLAEQFNVPQSNVEILCGETAKQKKVRILIA